MGVKSNFEKNMDKAVKQGGAQIAMKGGDAFLFNQLLNAGHDIEEKNQCPEGMYYCSKDKICKPDSQKMGEIGNTNDVEQEMGEATTSASAGAYVGPLGYAKNKKNWRGASKTQWPGGQFVKVKKKCSTFPYCNQGDINALELTSSVLEKKIMKEAVDKVSKKTGKKKEHIRELIKKEIEEIIRRSFYKSPVTSLVGTAKMNTPIGKIFTMSPKGVTNKYE